MYDLLIREGTIIDGTGRQRCQGDIAVSGNRIAKIGGSIKADAKRVVDAKGKVVSPGFIDSHSHADVVFLAGTSGYNYLEQGTTSEICGPCGESPAPCFDGFYKAYVGVFPADKLAEIDRISRSVTGFMQQARKLPIGTNMAFLVGQGTIRGRVMGYSMKEPGGVQLEQMREYVREAMDCGFLGISSGLVYPPSIYAGEQEIAELVMVAAQSGGIYSSHIRGEDGRSPEAVAEAIRIAEKCSAPLVISHHKIMGEGNEGLSDVTLGMISQANARGLKVRIDQYPYLAGAAGLIDAMPPRYRENGVDALLEQLKDSEFRRELTEVLKTDESFQNYTKLTGFGGFLIILSTHMPELIGQTVLQVAQARGRDPYETFYDLLIESNGSMFMGYVTQSEHDMMRILQYPYTMPGSDMFHNLAEYDPETVGGWHPRATGTMTRHLALIRDHGLLSLEAAIHRMTAMPADFYGLRDRGILREGAFADICIFDYGQIRDTADYVKPYRRNSGIDTVIVNGKVAVENGRYNGERAGCIMTRE